MTVTAYRRNEIADEETREERAARAVVKARIARAVAGGVGFAGGLAMFGAAIARGVSWGLYSRMSAPEDGLLVRVLVCAWVLMGVGYGIGVAAARARADRTLARARAVHPRDAVNGRRGELAWLCHRWEEASISLPLAAMAMLLPLTLHLVFWMAVGHVAQWREFDEWIRMSVAWVGIAHVTLAVCAARFAGKVSRTRDIDEDFGTRAGGRALGITVLASCIPGVVLLGIPPVITAVTGIVPVLLAFRAAAVRVARERAALDEAGL